LFGRATIVYFQKKTADGVLPFWLHELHQQYGPVVRYAPNEVSFTDPDVVKEVYSHRGMVFEKQTDFYGPDSYGNPPGLIRSDKVAHARQRRLVSQYVKHLLTQGIRSKLLTLFQPTVLSATEPYTSNKACSKAM
jgi:cytochrome P450